MGGARSSSTIQSHRSTTSAGRTSPVVSSRRRSAARSSSSHDFTFVYLLQEAAETAGIELHGQTLQRAFHRVGVLRDELPTKTLSPSKRRTNLRHRLRTELQPLYNRQDPNYECEADAWVTDLRKAYDQLIEDYVLAGTVRRWHAQVRVRRLRHIKWSPDIVARIVAGMKKAANKTHCETRRHR